MSSAAAAAAKPFRIGMLGAGTVGGGVYELLLQQAIPNMVIAKICVRDLDKPRDFTLQHTTTTLTTNPRDLLTDDIDCVVEVAGGCGVAKDIVLDALQLGKAVVTANKALLAEHMTAVEQAAGASSSPKHSQLGYEAAVCGGIPIINALSTSYVGDRIQSVAGICNGTTNFMLSAMAKDLTIQYADILRQAQELGYAEADPAADVEGHDVRAKIAILAKLAFGQTVPVDEIPCAGITKITSADFSYAQDQLNCTIKLIGTATLDDHQRLSVYVTPTLVPLTHMLAGITGSGNCVSVQSQNMGACHFTGPGAGRFPTANSIVADIYRAAAGTLPDTTFPVPWWAKTTTLVLDPDYEAQFYIRIPARADGSSSNNDEEAIVVLGTEQGLDMSSLARAGENLFAVIPMAKKSAVDQFCNALVQKQLTSSSSDAAVPLAMPLMKH